MSKRLVVFIDSQNVYMRARTIFDLEASDHPIGQINPLKASNLLASRLGNDFEVHQVRIYRGLPSNKVDPKGYGAVRRQTANWMKLGRTQVILRPIHYPRNWPESRPEDGLPREKGIDVELAVDFVSMAFSGEFDAGVIFSMDNDLKPPLEYVGKAHPEICIGVSSWWPERIGDAQSRPSTISIPEIGLKDIRLSRADFETVRDDTDFSH